MTPPDFDWRHAAVAAPALGALLHWLPRLPATRWRVAVAAATAGFAAACLAAPELDALSAALAPLVAALHLLTLLATTRAAFARTWLAGHLGGMAVRLAAVQTADPKWFVALLAAEACIPFAELRLRGQPARLFAGHAALWVGLLAYGAWGGVPAATVAGAALRCGLPPGHLWVANLFRRATMGTAMLHTVPMIGLLPLLRGGASLPWQGGAAPILAALAATYAAGLALVQREARGFFACMHLSACASIWCGLAADRTISLVGACGLWFADALALAALALTLRALEHRHGPLRLSHELGLHRSAPQLAAPFLVASLCAMGFPGAAGFVFAEALVDGVLSVSPGAGAALAIAAALQGIAALRAYWLLFSGGTRSIPQLPESPRERVATLALSLAVLLGGAAAPQILSATRRIAEALVAK